MSEQVEAAVRRGDLGSALALVMDEVRSAPGALGPRMALFQLACLDGQWDRAARQLDAIASLDSETATFTRVYRGLIEAEAARTTVFAGTNRPVTLGEPPAYIGPLAEALVLDSQGEDTAAATLRETAMEAAEAAGGEIDGQAFAWLMDADPRLGPTLELIVPSGYRWLPLANLKELRTDGARDLKDAVWLPVRVVLANGAESAAYMPVRYPGSERHADPLVRLGRACVWEERAAGQPFGFGQRMFASDAGDHPLLEMRSIRLPSASESGHG